jgi:hydrogenase/urease accessory protein HupE
MIRRAVVGFIVSLSIATPAAAHPAPFSYLDLHLSSSGIEGGLVVHDFDVAHDVGVDPPERLRDPAFAERYRDQLTRLMDSRLGIFVDGARVPLSWSGFATVPDRQSVRLTFHAADRRPGRVRVNTVLFPYDPIHQTFVNVYEDGELRHQAILSEQHASADYYAGTWQGTTAVLAVFIPAGIEHILIGPDHVLFLIGLMLLGGTLWRLTTIVTAFTLGHSVTLSLAALDVVSPPSSVVEPVIALSIVFVGADNLLVQRDRIKTAARDVRGSKPPRDIRAWVAGVFGLVHGFGFATVLKDFGLPLTALGWSLFSFNVGVEIGQLAIVLAVAAALRAIQRRDATLARRLVVAGSVIVMVAGAYWFVERVFLTGGTS